MRGENRNGGQGGEGRIGRLEGMPLRIITIIEVKGRPHERRKRGQGILGKQLKVRRGSRKESVKDGVGLRSLCGGGGGAAKRTLYG